MTLQSYCLSAGYNGERKKRAHVYLLFFFIVSTCLVRSLLSKTINVLSGLFHPNRFKSLSSRRRRNAAIGSRAVKGCCNNISYYTQTRHRLQYQRLKTKISRLFIAGTLRVPGFVSYCNKYQKYNMQTSSQYFIL